MRRLLIVLMVVAAGAVSVLVVARPDTPTPGSNSPSPVPTSTLPKTAQVIAPPPPATTTVGPPTSTDQPHEPAGTPLPATGTVAAGSAEQSAAWAPAAARAVGFMHAFARPPAGVNASAWWARVVSYLSPAAAADYAGTDPANVPFTAVTGPATVVPVEAPTELVIVVRVPTDAGDYLVDIQTTPTGLWVTRATPASR
jgi:hypothetical protein